MPDLINNSSFEQDTPGNGNTPAQWQSYLSSGAPTYQGVANDYAPFGANSYKIAAAANVDAGIEIDLHGFFVGEDVTVSLYAKTDASVVNANFTLDTSQHGAGGAKTQTTNIGASQNGKFTQTITMDATQLNLFLGLGSFGANSAGTVWYDYIKIERFAKNNTGLRPRPFGPGLAR